MAKTKKRAYAYYDGSNFYHAVKANYGITAIQFHHMTNQLLDMEQEELIKIRYFNAPVNQQESPEGYAKQLKFFDQLKKTPLLDLSLGRLVRRPLNKITVECVSCGLQKADSFNCPQCARNIGVANTYKVTEKGVDVQLAISLLLDALNNRYDIALLFSGDADFCPAVRYIVRNLGKEIVFCHFPTPKTDELKQCCTESRLITKDKVQVAQVISS